MSVAVSTSGTSVPSVSRPARRTAAEARPPPLRLLFPAPEPRFLGRISTRLRNEERRNGKARSFRSFAFYSYPNFSFLLASECRPAYRLPHAPTLRRNNVYRNLLLFIESQPAVRS